MASQRRFKQNRRQLSPVRSVIKQGITQHVVGAAGVRVSLQGKSVADRIGPPGLIQDRGGRAWMDKQSRAEQASHGSNVCDVRAVQQSPDLE